MIEDGPHRGTLIWWSKKDPKDRRYEVWSYGSNRRPYRAYASDFLIMAFMQDKIYERVVGEWCGISWIIDTRPKDE